MRSIYEGVYPNKPYFPVERKATRARRFACLFGELAASINLVPGAPRIFSGKTQQT